MGTSFYAQETDLEESITGYIFLLRQMQKMYKKNSKLDTNPKDLFNSYQKSTQGLDREAYFFPTKLSLENVKASVQTLKGPWGILWRDFILI